MSVFRSTLSKQIAHTTILPALGNKDLKLLQDLITAEKFAVSSSQKLADDWAKAADALKAWGAGEGDDLGDVLDKSRELLVLVSAALSQLSTHETAIRVHMKAVRTREENLDELKRRRKQVGSKAEAADKKLSKMSPEHKQLQMQRDLLNQLREEMRQLDSTILVEEARLSDYKRQTTKDWMALKFGGLSELAEKVMIVGNTGKQLIEEIPLEQTQPGFGRVPYVAQTQTSSLLAAASQRVGEVTFQPTTGNLAYHYEPGPGTGHQQQQPHHFAEPAPNVPQQGSIAQRHAGGLPPQPEPHVADDASEFGQFPGGQLHPPYHSQTVSSATGSDVNRPYPPRMDSRFATLPNNVGRPDFNDHPPSPAVPPKDIPPLQHQPPLPSEDPRHSVRRSASGLSETGADLVLAYYHDLEATGETADSTTSANQTNASAPGRRSDVRASFDEDPYATDDRRAGGVTDDSRLGGRPRSPPPSFEVATSTPPTPAFQPRNIPMASYEPDVIPNEVLPPPTRERGLSTTSAMSDTQRQQQALPRSESGISSESSLSTLPSPHPPFAADPTAIASTGRGGAAAVMPGSANSPPLSPADPVTPNAKTISAGAFKRFRGPGSSTAGSPLPDAGGSPLSTPFGARKPPMEPAASYQSGNSNYASAPSSPPADNSGASKDREDRVTRLLRCQPLKESIKVTPGYLTSPTPVKSQKVIIIILASQWARRLVPMVEKDIRMTHSSLTE
ncbi:hypothetical protein FS837_009674 [Tulasnella sp. UAMH 9824]|nr:hypothetical protein FS837_009674 [Tulasnella sp. UAMH 9824]